MTAADIIGGMAIGLVVMMFMISHMARQDMSCKHRGGE